MKEKMKAQVFYKPEIMKLEEIDIPSISDDEVLVAVKACGICGSDIDHYYGKSPIGTPTGKGPIVFGHEISGEIVEVGKKVKDMKVVKIGDRVIVNPVQSCNRCFYCLGGYTNLCKSLRILGDSLNGGFTEYVKTDLSHVYKMPGNISFEEGTIIEPLSCAVYAVENLQVSIGDFVLIIGSGAIGFLIAQLAKFKGAGRTALVDISDYSLKLGKELGADYIINTLDKNSPYYTHDLKEEVLKLNNGELAQRVIVSTGAKVAQKQALEVSGVGSIVVYFGVPDVKDTLNVNLLETLTSDKTLRFSWISQQTWGIAIRAVEMEMININKLITNKYDHKQAVRGIAIRDFPSERRVKAVVTI